LSGGSGGSGKASEGGGRKGGGDRDDRDDDDDQGHCKACEGEGRCSGSSSGSGNLKLSQ